MKKALLATLIGAAFAADASAAAIDFSYVDEIYTYYGSQKKEVYDVAIFLPAETFQGMKVVSVSCPINAQRGVSKYADPKVWLSSELKLESKKNAPDIASYDATIVEGDGDGTANIVFQFPEAYEVPAAGVYVGYSFETTAMDGGTKYPIGIGLGGGPNSFFLHSSKSTTSWTNVAVADGYSSAMSLVVEADNLPNENVSLVNLPDPIYMTIGEDKTVSVSLISTALNPVNSVDFEFTIAGVTSTSHYDLPSPVAAGISKSFNAKLTLPAQDVKLSEQVEVKVAKVNGVANESTEATATTSISTFDLAPVHLALMEEMTCTKCGYCTRGFAALEYIKKNYPEYICVSYHNNGQGTDPMTVGAAPVSASGNPSAALDRVLTNIDPYYGTQTYGGPLPILGDIEAINDVATPWALKVTHTWDYDNILTANVEYSNVEGFEKGKYKIGYILVSDGLTGEGNLWTQSNYYNSYAPDFIPELNQFCKGGIYGQGSVIGLVYNDVVISIKGYKGVDQSVPTSMIAEEINSHSMSWDLNDISADLVQDKNKLRIVAIILDSKGKVLNSAKQDVIDFVATGNEGSLSAVQTVGIDENAPVEYFNLNGQKVDNPAGGIFIRRQGTSTEKVVIK